MYTIKNYFRFKVFFTVLIAKVQYLLQKNSKYRKHMQIFFSICFCMYGFVNNLGYVVSLSAAKDILQNEVPASVVLICDVVPSLFSKLVVPYIQTVSFILKIVIEIILALIGFILTAQSQKSFGLGLTGVVFHSISSGIGEPVFLQYTTLFGDYAVTGWCVGTGLAGFVGSFIYGILTTVGHCSPTQVLYSFTFFPILMLITMIITEYWLKVFIQLKVDKNEINRQIFSKQAFKQLKIIWLQLLSLLFVYFSEYLINQGVDSVIDYPDKSYTGYYYTYSQFCYQLGQFLSRSSIQFIKIPIKFVWITSALQFLFLILFCFEAVYKFINNFYVQLILCVFEGIFGGLTYSQAMYQVKLISDEKYKQFNLSIAAIIDTIGIIIASLVGCFLEPWLRDIKQW